MMKARIASITLLILAMLLAGCGTADTPDAAPVVNDQGASAEEQAGTQDEESEPVTGEVQNITGIWEGVLTHELVDGGCPPTPTQQGTVLIEQVGSTFTLQFGEGFTCSPAEACDFTGAVDGVEYTATNGGVADSEGGIYSTTFTLTLMAEDVLDGIGTSTYQHPEMQCEWVTSLSLMPRGAEE